jgi:hypothetical protein
VQATSQRGVLLLKLLLPSPSRAQHRRGGALPPPQARRLRLGSLELLSNRSCFLC